MFKVIKQLSIIFVATQLIGAVHAQSEKKSDQSLREKFLSAEKALKRHHRSRYQRLKTELNEYPLYPYLEYSDLKQRIHVQKPETIKTFLDTYYNTPLANKLRIAWLLNLVKRNDQKQFLAFYKAGLSTNLTCRYVGYKLKSGSTIEQLDAPLRSIWFTHRSLPNSCDAVVQKWRQAGFLSEDDIWRRMAIAIGKGKVNIVSHLNTLLPKESQYLGHKWIRLRNNPARILTEARKPSASDKEAEIFTYAIKRLTWRDLDKALAIWEKLQSLRHFSTQQLQTINETFVINLVTDNHPQAKPWLKGIPDLFTSVKINEWRLRYALLQEDWELADHWLKTTNDWGDTFTQEGIDYWSARAQEKLGNSDYAKLQFKRLAQNRGFYGFLASSIVGLAPSFKHQPAQVPEAVYAYVANMPGVKRAKELHDLNRLTDARREWYYLKKGLSQKQLEAAAIMASKWEWHDRAIFTLAKAKRFDDVDIRFPLAYQEELQRASLKQDIITSWSYAITRQESAFMRDARSHVGATGLMQLMPYTAKYLAKKMRIKYAGKYDLLKPQKNINFGTYYLGELARKYDGNMVYATASYNAGPHRVVKWIDDPDQALDIWIENIPFSETRKYVKRVLAYQVIYSHKLNEQETIIAHTVAPNLNLSFGSTTVAHNQRSTEAPQHAAAE